MSTMSLRLPESLHRRLREFAEKDDVSINQLITTAVAEKLAALSTVEYLEARAARGSRARFEAALAQVPDMEPMPEDFVREDGSSYTAPARSLRERKEVRRSVILFGASHSIQRGERERDLFEAALKGACEKYEVRAIAEEIASSDKTVALSLARRLHIKHLYADPGYAERVASGIEVDIGLTVQREYLGKYPKIGLWPKEPSRKNLPARVWGEYSRRIGLEHRAREQFWLNKIITLDTWPLLFICGANHFEEFAKLLKKHRLKVVKSSKDWTP